MKKLLLASIMMLTITLSANNTKTTLDSVKTTVESLLPDSTQLTFKEVYSDIKAGLSGLAQGLKIGSERVYEVLIRQQCVRAYIWCLVLLFGLILLTYFIYCFNSKNRFKIKTRYNKNSDDEEEYIDKKEWDGAHITKTIIMGLISIMFMIPGCFHIDIILTGFINPEYGTIKEILEFVK